jgi:PAS domain S-box-containing protein
MNKKKIPGSTTGQDPQVLAALIENSNDIALVKDLDRRILSGNTNFIRSTGLASAAEVIGKRDADILGIPENEEPAHSLMLDDLKALSLPLGESLMREEQLPLGNGEVHTILTRKFPIGTNGKTVSLGVISTDITSIREAEKAREEQAALVAMIMETSPVGITTVDENGSITYANSRAEQIFGLTKSEITARSYNAPLWNLTDLDGGPFPEVNLPFNIVKETRKPVYNIRHGITWPDGHCIILSINASPMMDAKGNFQGMVSTLEDITDRVRNEKTILKQLEDNKLLLKEAHHRIKNNIASIEALLAMQLDSLSNPEAVSALKDALGRVGSIRALYENLLIHQDQESVRVRPYAEGLADAVVSLLASSTSIVVEKKIDEFELDSKVLFPLGIIINELLTNIMKYAFVGRTEGTISIELTIDQDNKLASQDAEHHNRGTVQLTIQDNGIGLPEGFNPETTKGFGLMLVRMLSGQLGGTFTTESLKGTRSVLSFTV